MKLAVMQPYTFPYIGYFQLINHVDKWVIFDDTQYLAKGWINRNRILHPDLKKEWQYFTVPVKKHSIKSRIKEIEINDELKWRDELLGKLTSYKKKAPFYAETRKFVGDCISFKCSALSKWIEHTLKSTCDYLNVPFDYSVFSQMNINTDNVNHAGQWALEIADAMDADEYVNPPSGYSIFNEDEFLARNIDIRFLKPNLTPYIQRRGCFVSGLSIIDVMMWNDKDRIHEILKDYEIVTQSKLRDYDNE
jgi:hypothetical protein